MPPENNKNAPDPNEDDKLMEGHPQDGDIIEEDNPPPNPSEPNEDGNDDPPSQEPSVADVMAALQQVTGELNTLKRQLNQQPKQPPKEEEPEDVDWEQMLFRDPNEAVRRLKEDITKELTGKYTQTQQQAQFWNDFYSQHQDLKEDKDLVEATMAKNMATLATMEVTEASKKLAELTRERILRYSGKKPPQGKKVQVEGNDPPRPKAPQKEPEKVTTLSDLIRARKAKRAKGTAA